MVDVNSKEKFFESKIRITGDEPSHIDVSNFKASLKVKLSKGNIANITSNYSEGDIEGYEEIIIASIDSSFENILSNNFIIIESVNQISNTASNELSLILKRENLLRSFQVPLPGMSIDLK